MVVARQPLGTTVRAPSNVQLHSRPVQFPRRRVPSDLGLRPQTPLQRRPLTISGGVMVRVTAPETVVTIPSSAARFLGKRRRRRRARPGRTRKAVLTAETAASLSLRGFTTA